MSAIDQVVNTKKPY